MQIDIQVHGLVLTKTLRSFFERRLFCALSLRYEQIREIRADLSVVKDHQGREVQCCQLHIAMSGQRRLCITDTHNHIYVAIESAVSRADRALSRQLVHVRDAHFDDAAYAVRASAMV